MTGWWVQNWLRWVHSVGDAVTLAPVLFVKSPSCWADFCLEQLEQAGCGEGEDDSPDDDGDDLPGDDTTFGSTEPDHRS